MVFIMGVKYEVEEEKKKNRVSNLKDDKVMVIIYFDE